MSNMMDDRIRERLEFDAVAEAEMFTGKRHEQSEFVQQFALSLAIGNNHKKDELLEFIGDTRYNSSLSEYIEIIQKGGFELVFEQEFHDDKKRWSWEEDPTDEKFMVFFHPKYGILLEFDTYRNQSTVNGGRFYYNIKPNCDVRQFCQWTSSGGYEHMPDGSYVWVGWHDCREAVLFRIRKLAENGTFITPWVEADNLMLLNYMEWHELEKWELSLKESGTVRRNILEEKFKLIDNLTQQKIKQMPRQVQKAIRFGK